MGSIAVNFYERSVPGKRPEAEIEYQFLLKIHFNVWMEGGNQKADFLFGIRSDMWDLLLV